jgi:hypothetical protein
MQNCDNVDMLGVGKGAKSFSYSEEPRHLVVADEKDAVIGRPDAMDGLVQIFQEPVQS